MSAALATPRERWQQSCAASIEIRARFGANAAVDYLIGNKLLSFAELAEHDPAYRAEILDFVGRIRALCSASEIAAHFERSERAARIESDVFEGASDDEVEALKESFEELRRERETRSWLRPMLLGRGS